jgi:hypothetical protein
MGVGGQRNTPATLPPGKTRYPLYTRLGGPQSRSGRVPKISSPTRIRSPDRPARSELLYRLSYSGAEFPCINGNLYLRKDLNYLLTQTSVQVFVPVCSRVATKVCGISPRSLQCCNSRQQQLITMLAPPAVVPECSSHFRPSLSFKWTCISATIMFLYFLFFLPSASTCTFSPLPQFYVIST